MFHELRTGRTIQRPEPDHDVLTTVDADFTGEFELDEVLVDGGSRDGVHGGGSISESLITHVNLSKAKLSPLTLTEVLFDEVDLSNAALQNVVLRMVELRRCRAIGLGISVDQASDLYAEDTQFDFAGFHLARVRGVAAFVGCSFKEATVSGDLSNVVFDGCDFTGTEFRATGAFNCDLRSSRLTGARGLSTLRGAVISAEQAVSIAAELAVETGLIIRD